jgi:glycosyltransferase involved in cell wall biosynthesis
MSQLRAVESPVDESGQHHIVIVSCSFNNERFYKWSLASVIAQQYDNWHLLYVDDDSPDGTGDLVQEYIYEHGIEDKVLLIRNKDRVKAMANLYKAIHACNPTDVVAILDGDDRFAQDKALQRVNRAYENPNIWLTYGQFRVHGGFPFYCHPYPKSVIDSGSFRSYLNTPSHLRTFYAGLFHKIKKEDMMKDGNFFEMTYDLAMMFPMVEMARTHFTFIPDVLVDYNNANPINDHKVNKGLQRSIDQEIRHKARYQEIDSPF